MRRAGPDYHARASVALHDSFEEFVEKAQPNHCYALSTKGTQHYHEVGFEAGDAIVFGPETRGLPQSIREHAAMTRCIRIPMKENSRSLNLSNATAVVLYEAWRQLGFEGSR